MPAMALEKFFRFEVAAERGLDFFPAQHFLDVGKTLRGGKRGRAGRCESLVNGAGTAGSAAARVLMRVFMIDARDASPQNGKLVLEIAHSPFLC
jgi:hypothetical protein